MTKEAEQGLMAAYEAHGVPILILLADDLPSPLVTACKQDVACFTVVLPSCSALGVSAQAVPLRSALSLDGYTRLLLIPNADVSKYGRFQQSDRIRWPLYRWLQLPGQRRAGTGAANHFPPTTAWRLSSSVDAFQRWPG